jgi:alcohol dehydrogenase YqhD (iron-dependent ADH family)
MVHLGDEAQMELISVRLGIVLILWHDWCTVCVKHMISAKFDLDAAKGMPR